MIDLAAVRMAVPAKERIEQLSGVSLSKKENSAQGILWKGPCPFCGGTDRFVVNERTNRWWCRRCSETEEHWGDGLDFVKHKHPGITIREAVQLWTGQANVCESELKIMAEERRKANEVEAVEREKILEVKREKLQQYIVRNNLWQKWHDRMTAVHRVLWANRGIPDWAQDKYGLGYVVDLPHEVYRVPLEVITDAAEYREALAIHYPGSDVFGQFRYRAPNGHGAYHNLKYFATMPFITDPDRPWDIVIGHEAAIKAINGKLWGAGDKYQVIGRPSDGDYDCLIPYLKNTKKYIDWSDPDVFIKPIDVGPDWLPKPIRFAYKLKKLYPNIDIRIVQVSFKSDDAQLAGLDEDQYLSIVAGARPLSRWPKKF